MFIALGSSLWIISILRLLVDISPIVLDGLCGLDSVNEDPCAFGCCCYCLIGISIVQMHLHPLTFDSEIL